MITQGLILCTQLKSAYLLYSHIVLIRSYSLQLKTVFVESYHLQFNAETCSLRFMIKTKQL